MKNRWLPVCRGCFARLIATPRSWVVLIVTGLYLQKTLAPVRAMLAAYDGLLDGTHGTEGCPILNTKALEPFGLIRNGAYQNLGCAVVYPADYFNPYDDALGRLKKTPNTYSIHWYAKSWMSRRVILRSKLSKPWHRLQHLFGRR